jgi:signal peptidase II
VLAALVLAAVLVLALDQATKALVVRKLSIGRIALALPGLAPRLRRVENARAPFGVGHDGRLLVALWAGTFLGACLASALVDPIGRIGLGMAVGGAAGNVLDRLRRGAVVDFVDLRVWPVFNLADLAIVVGVCLAIWRLA